MTSDILEEIMSERNHQIAKWGFQRLPNGTGEGYAAHARLHRRYCDLMAREGRGSWTDILLEEVYEALEQSDQSLLRAELVQAAAVVVAWIEAIDVQNGAGL